MLEALHKNADRFKGFADTYDEARPKMPGYPAEVIARWLGRAPHTVVDLGCGTGLSLPVWQGKAEKVVGVEPSGDMLALAKAKNLPNTTFVQAFAHETGLPDSMADVVICSQSFHWMEPAVTLREVGRILKPNGIFATVDCDWPPVCDWRAEDAYRALREREQDLELAYPDLSDSFVRFPKERHLQNIKESGQFSYTREIVFANRESCTSERLSRLMLSQGGLQAILRLHPEEIEADLARFRETVFSIYGNTPFPIEFCYRMRIGVK